jgi:hypothetical protein
MKEYTGDERKGPGTLDEALGEWETLAWEASVESAVPEEREPPDPAWVKGRCPVCGGDVVSNTYYVGGRGYFLRLECWNSLGSDREPTCDYRKVL